LLPVGGPIYQSAAEAIREKGGDIALIGVDADVYNTDPTVADLLLTSVMKSVDAGVHDTVLVAAKGQFDATPAVDTHQIGGISIPSFHDWESKVPADLAATLDELKAQIIAGDIVVESPATPKQLPNAPRRGEACSVVLPSAESSPSPWIETMKLEQRDIIKPLGTLAAQDDIDI